MPENPVLINELRQSVLRRKPLLCLGMWTALTLLTLYLGPAFVQESQLQFLPFIVIPLVVPSFTAGLFASEYERQTWQDIFLTLITNRELLSGKFLAAYLQTISIMSALFVGVLIHSMDEQLLSGAQGLQLAGLLWHIVYTSAFAVLLGMVCSRYATNRRHALMFCYISQFLYAMMQYAIIMTVTGTIGADGLITGLTVHTIFSLVVGIGSFVLLWVSLGSDRGFRGSGGTEVGTWKTSKQPRAAASSEL